MINIMENEVIGPAIRHGIEEGKAQGMRSMLSRLLALKFGTLPDYASPLLDAASENALLLCADRLLTAGTIDEVLVPAIADTVAQGEKYGIRCTLVRLLMKAFGPLPDFAVGRLDRASKDELLEFVDRVLISRTLPEVFGYDPPRRSPAATASQA